MEHEEKKFFLNLIITCSEELTGHAFIDEEEDTIELIIDSIGISIMGDILDIKFYDDPMYSVMSNLCLNNVECNPESIQKIFKTEVELEDGTYCALIEACECLKDFNTDLSYSIIGDGCLSISNKSLIEDSFLVQDLFGLFPSISE